MYIIYILVYLAKIHMALPERLQAALDRLFGINFLMCFAIGFERLPINIVSIIDSDCLCQVALKVSLSSVGVLGLYKILLQGI